MNNHRQVVVIGAGISGLVCAYRLKKLGVDVALLEKSDRFGGVIQSERIDGYLIERGPNSSRGTEEMMALIAELDLMNELVEGDPKAPAFVFFNGSLHPVPTGPGAFVKSRLLSTRGKLRLLAEPFAKASPSGREESVFSFAERRIGREAAERLVAPFISGIFAGDANAVSVQAAFPRLAALETGYGSLFRGAIAKARESRREKKAGSVDPKAPRRRRSISFRQGMSVLTDTLAARLGEDVINGCRDLTAQIVDSPEFGSNDSREFKISFRRDGRVEEMISEKLVVATPAQAAGSLVVPLAAELRLRLEEIPYPPLAILYLAYEENAVRKALNGFGFLVPPSEGLSILGCVWNSSLFGGRAPAGKILLTVFMGGATNPDIARLTDEELVVTAHSELQRAMGIAGEPRVVGITRYENSIPQYNLGHAARVAEIERLVAKVPGLTLIGNYLHGVSTGDCISEAERTARNVLAGLR